MDAPVLHKLERQTVQTVPDATQNNAPTEFWSYTQTRGFILPRWGTRAREKELRQYYRHEYNWMGQSAFAGLAKKVKSAAWEIKGKQRVRYFQDVLRQADFGRGWDTLISKTVLDFLRQDGGAYWELIAPGNPRREPTGMVSGIAHLDSLRCFPTGDPEYPVLYTNRDGQEHLMHHTRIVHLVDMPDGDEANPGYGLCALSRAIAIVTQQIHMMRFIEGKLDDKPEPGYMFWKGVAKEQRIARFEEFRQQQQADNPTWGKVIHFESLDPSNPVGAESLSFAAAPDAWSFKEYTDLHVNAWALALGVDVQELWQLSGGNIGSGQQSQILHAKSQGKTFGDLLTGLERSINDVLPETLKFEFKRHDPYEAQEEASTAQLWAGFTSAASSTLSTDEQRRLLASRVEPYKDVVTDEKGEVIRLDDADVHPEGEQEIVDDATPQNENAEPIDTENPATSEQMQDSEKAVKAIQATRLDFEADWSDMVQARRSGDMNGRRGDIIARALLAKYIGQSFDDGLSEGGVDERDSDDESEVLALIADASGYVTDFNSTVETLSDAEAASKPTLWWNKSISAAYDAGRLSADRNGVYEFVGDDGEESCETCVRLKGQVHRMKDWTRKQLRPGVDTKSYVCGGFQCNHHLVKTTGRTKGKF